MSTETPSFMKEPVESNGGAKRGKQGQEANKELGFALIRLAGRSSQLEPNIVSVGINGKPYNMQRGKLIPVPHSVTHALDNATIPLYSEEEEDENTKRRRFIGMAKRYPYELVRKLDKERYESLRTIAQQRDITDADLSSLGM